MRRKSDFPNLNLKQPNGLKPGGKPYRAMVVDDKEFQRKQLVQILESESYEVIATASNGQEALQKYEKVGKDLDFITTSLDMPIMDGYALLYELNQKDRRPTVIFVSDETTKGVMTDLLSMGIADYILKPINRRVFLDRVKKAIQK